MTTNTTTTEILTLIARGHFAGDARHDFAQAVGRLRHDNPVFDTAEALAEAIVRMPAHGANWAAARLVLDQGITHCHHFANNPKAMEQMAPFFVAPVTGLQWDTDGNCWYEILGKKRSVVSANWAEVFRDRPVHVWETQSYHKAVRLLEAVRNHYGHQQLLSANEINNLPHRGGSYGFSEYVKALDSITDERSDACDVGGYCFPVTPWAAITTHSQWDHTELVCHFSCTGRSLFGFVWTRGVGKVFFVHEENDTPPECWPSE